MNDTIAKVIEEEYQRRENERIALLGEQIQKGCDKCSQWDDFWGCKKCEKSA